MRHWLRRQKAYRELPTKTLWWRRYEPVLVAGIAARDRDALPPVIMLGQKHNRSALLVLRLIEAADAARRKQ